MSEGIRPPGGGNDKPEPDQRAAEDRAELFREIALVIEQEANTSPSLHFREVLAPQYAAALRRIANEGSTPTEAPSQIGPGSPCCPDGSCSICQNSP